MYGASLIRGIIAWWHARQRAIDIQMLWPACIHAAPGMDAARAAFAMHAFQDKAWLELGDEEIKRRISALGVIESTKANLQ